MLLEKLDSNRVRLKRPAVARKGDAHLNFDPYRTAPASESNTLLSLLWLGIGIVAGSTALVVAWQLIQLWRL